MAALGWVVVVLVGWCVVAVAVGLLVARVIRLRDCQVPHPERPVTGIPAQRRASDPALDRDPELGAR